MKRLLLSVPCFLMLLCCKNASNDTSAMEVSGEQSSFLRMDTLTQLPPEFAHLIKGYIQAVYKVDFTGDGKQDIICKFVPPDNPDSIDYVETWITSEKRIAKTIKRYLADYDYLRFVNLDKDPEPEIFHAHGWPDGIDYWLEDQDLSTGQDELLFYFFPVIIEDGKQYWGYAWDIQDIAMKKDAGNIYIQSSKDHDLTIGWESSIDSTVTNIPVVFFYGHHTQESTVESIRHIRWMTLDELDR